MGYFKIYSPLSPQELRQHRFRERYKKINPSWDDSLILLCKLFKPFAKKGMRVLDAGCGRGNIVVDEFRKEIKEAVGIDIDQKATRGNVCLDKVVIGDLESMPFLNEEFDVVLSQWVFEHLKNPDKVFPEIYRVLKPGGAFLFVTPYKGSYIILTKRILGAGITRRLLSKSYGREEKDVFPAYYRANTPKILEEKLNQVGFKKKTLFLNTDPSYLGINDFLFSLGVFLERAPFLIPFNLTKMHILGVFVKIEDLP